MRSFACLAGAAASAQSAAQSQGSPQFRTEGEDDGVQQEFTNVVGLPAQWEWLWHKVRCDRIGVIRAPKISVKDNPNVQKVVGADMKRALVQFQNDLTRALENLLRVGAFKHHGINPRAEDMRNWQVNFV